MIKINLSEYANNDCNNKGDCREWALCRYYGIERTVHDTGHYDKDSDLVLTDRCISVKASGSSLMGGTLCIGCTTFEGIWRRYYKRTHSNEWAYITKNWDCYLMNKKEFSKFIHKFGYLARESSKNGGYLKIKLLNESKKQLAWLDLQAV